MKITALLVSLYSLLQFVSSCSDTSVKVDKDEIRESLNEKLKVDRASIVVKNVNLISMETNAISEGMDVYVKDGEIEKILKTQTTDQGYLVIDGTNLFLMPGLADMHVHFIDDQEYNAYNSFLFLANGVTTVRIMWGVEGNLSLRNRINSGEILGPRMYVASGGFNGSVPLWPGTVTTNTTEEIRSKVRKFKADGYDFIKIYSNIPKDQFEALVDEASKEGLKPIGHLPQSVDLNYAMSQKQYSIEHLGGFSKLSVGSSTFIESVNVSRASGTWHCPTMIVQNRSSALVDQYKDEEYYALISPGWKNWYTYPLAQPPTNNPTPGHVSRMAVLGELHNAGVNIISGTDMGIRYIYPGVSLHEELTYYVEAGMTPYEALKTSTRNVSNYLQDPTTGTIGAGKSADLLLLKSNPLTNISNIRSIAGVVTKGTWFSKKDIDEIKSMIHDLYR